VSSTRCEECVFDIWHHICTLRSAEDLPILHLGLYNDARFPGRCILSWNTHASALEDMSTTQLSEMMVGIASSALAIRMATGAARVNVAILGNTEAHVHAHLIPRYPAFEVNPTMSPWDDPRDRSEELLAWEFGWLLEEIGATLQTLPPKGDKKALEGVRNRDPLVPVPRVRAMLESHWPELPHAPDSTTLAGHGPSKLFGNPEEALGRSRLRIVEQPPDGGPTD